MFDYLKRIWKTAELRNKLIFTLLLLIVDRIAVHITVPVDHPEVITDIMEKNQMLGAFSALMGGSMTRFSIVLMGLSPYINASIIIQLMTVVIPKLEAISKEGEEGQRKIQKYTRVLTFPLAFLQSYGMILLMNNTALQFGSPIIDDTSFIKMMPIMLTITTGTLFLVWLGDQISEYGIGNGISLLIFTSIVSGIPSVVGQTLGIAGESQEKYVVFAVLLAITILLTIFIVLLNEGVRNIPVSYGARRGATAQKSFLPIRVNQAGMIPIIFAVSLITFPSIFANFFRNSENAIIKSIAEWIFANISGANPGVFYILIYFLLVIFFSYFYVSITFNPDRVSENIQKRGGFIPGVRPGRETSSYLGKVSSALNLWGGSALGIIAIFPLVFTAVSSRTGAGAVPLLISGAGLIIVVGTILELIRQINSEMIMHDYEKMY